MNTFRNRLAIGLIGILILMSVAMALTIVRVEQLRSSVRLQAADQAQIQGYFELHAKLRESSMTALCWYLRGSAGIRN